MQAQTTRGGGRVNGAAKAKKKEKDCCDKLASGVFDAAGSKIVKTGWMIEYRAQVMLWGMRHSLQELLGATITVATGSLYCSIHKKTWGGLRKAQIL